MKWIAAFLCMLQHSYWVSAACSIVEQYSAAACAASGFHRHDYHEESSPLEDRSCALC